MAIKSVRIRSCACPCEVRYLQPSRLFLHTLAFCEQALPSAHMHRTSNRSQHDFIVFRVPDSAQGNQTNRNLIVSIFISGGGGDLILPLIGILLEGIPPFRFDDQIEF